MSPIAHDAPMNDLDPSLDPSLATTPGHAAPVLHRLNADWRRITVSLAELRTISQWSLPGGPVFSFDELLVRCGFRGHLNHGSPFPPTDAAPVGECADPDTADRCLLALVDRARSDQLAGRVVLQRIVPPLCAVARRHTSDRAQRDALFDNLVGNAWPVICGYPVTRRRHHVAANLVRDIAFDTLVRPSRRRSATELPIALDDSNDAPTPVATDPFGELVELLAEALRAGSISTDDTELLGKLIQHNHVVDVAAALKIAPRTVRNHRDATVSRLRSYVASAA